MKVLLIGATGQLGRDLLRNNPGHDIVAPGRDELDLQRPQQAASTIREVRPEYVINCAAFHNVPLCEQQPEQAFFVNCVAVKDLAVACVETGAWLITFSSDYVFGGDQRIPYVETDSPGPLQIYGITRLAGEYAALANAPQQAIIIRTCGLYGQFGARSKGGNFVDFRVAEARAGARIEMSCEQIVTPTSTEDLSRALYSLIARSELVPGVYHLINEGRCSWYEFTRAIVEILNCPVEVVPVDRGGRDLRGFRRPIFSALRNTRAADLGIVLPPWKTALRNYLGQYQ